MKIEIKNPNTGQMELLRKCDNPTLFAAIVLASIRNKKTSELTMDDLLASGSRGFNMNTTHGGGL
jgi:hypothetical protein